jgi:L-asparaginase / beta-aspartyl-peptidase
MDASIMDGETLDVGAVCALKDTPNPIGVARALLRERETLLAGQGAFRFAQSRGLAKPGSGRRLVAEGAGTTTVGCVALDVRGHLAAATSTGGTGASKPGRVGDSPIPGLGTYADDAIGAVSATGEGESISRVLLGARVVMLLEGGHHPQSAAEQSLAHLSRVGGDAGLIVLDRHGRIGWKHTGDQFALGWATGHAPAPRIEIANLDEAEDG